MDEHPKAAILDGVRILDLTRFLSGPTATLFLAGLGAEAIRIDEPSGDPTAAAPPFLGPLGVSLRKQTDDDLGLAYLKRARAKKAVTLNLKSPEGLALFFRLVEQSDAVVENFRVGVTERLGIDWPRLRARNPRLVHCAITGFGATGPDAHLKAYDPIVQAAAGLMGITGTPGEPPVKAGTPLSDCIAGTFAALGVVGALLQREKTGLGQSVDVSMADCLLALLMDEPLDCYDRLGLDPRQGNRVPRFSPFNSYKTADGYVTLGAATAAEWIAMLTVMGRRDLLDSPDYMNVGWRLANNDAVDAIVSAWTADRPSAEIVERMTAADVACGPVRSPNDIVAWEHPRARGLLAALPHPLVPNPETVLAAGFPLKFSGARTGYDRPAPLIGEHNDRVFGDYLGLDAAALAALRKNGTI